MAAVTDADIELLNALLDGELTPDERRQVHVRIEDDKILRGEFERMRDERSTRIALYRSFEGDDELPQRMMDRVGMPARTVRRWAILRPAAAAAVVALVFFAGWAARGRFVAPAPVSGPAAASAPVVYHVAIRDDTGTIMAVQKFKTLKEAEEFSEDLRRWQERQEQLFSGQPVVRSASF